jgi:cyclic 2,3-diphosphoglycerate synthase
VKAVALVDGEHVPAVVREALAELPYEWVGAVLVGGSEKLRGEPDYGVPLLADLADGIGAGAEVAVDLSDEPVLGPAERMRWASRALAAGLTYEGADFRFDPPRFEPWERPQLTIAVIGTRKRAGKTAVAGHVARLLAREHDVVVVAIGRGGPPEPELVESPPTVAELVALSRAGRHAASDHLETAAIYGVPTIGCRRAGGGLAGRMFVSNVLDGARLAAARRPDAVVFDSSGTAIPPVEVDRRVLVVGPGTDLDEHFNLYRRLISDVVVSVGGEIDGAFPATLRLRALEPLEGRVAVFTAGGADTSGLDADVVLVSRSLGDRAALDADLARADADTYLVELKGAAIDVVAEHALARGKRVVLAANDVVAPELDQALLALAPVAAAAS